jgi:hypothetical protein
VIEGGLGNDTYVFDADSALGSDTLTENPIEGGADTIDFSATSSSIGTSVTPFSTRVATPQVINASLTLTLTGGRGFETVVPGSGSNFIARRHVALLSDVPSPQPWSRILMDQGPRVPALRGGLPSVGSPVPFLWKLP